MAKKKKTPKKEEIDEEKVDEEKVDEEKVDEEKVDEEKVDEEKVNKEKVDKEEIDEEEVDDKDEEKANTKKTKKKRKKIETKLFDRWSFDGLEVKDISLQKYLNIDPIIIPHSGGKHNKKRFWKSEHISIVERFINRIMTPGLVKKRIKGRGSSQNMGKKSKILKVVYNAFAIIEYKEDKNPIQVLISAIENAAPREETTKISLGGISYQQAVDIAPQRRIDLALKIIVQATVGQAYNNIKTIDELLANELILCAKNDNKSKAVKRKDETERVAISAR